MKETANGPRRLAENLGPLCIQPAHDRAFWKNALSRSNSRKVIKRPRNPNRNAAAAADSLWPLASAVHDHSQQWSKARRERPSSQDSMEAVVLRRPVATKYVSVWPRFGHAEYDVFVGNLESCISASTLASWFEPFANVLHARIITDHSSGQSRGFGFVTFGSEPSMNKAIRALNGTEQAGKIIRVEQSSPKVFEGGI